jgi:hypothetical protein
MPFWINARFGFVVQIGSDSHFRTWTCTIAIAATRVCANQNENAQSSPVPSAIILMHAVTFVEVLVSALYQMRTKKLGPK